MVTIPKLKERNVSVSFANIRKNKEQSEAKEAIVEKLERREETQVTEIVLETPGQSLNEDGKKMNVSTPMPNTVEQESQTMDTWMDSRWIRDIRQYPRDNRSDSLTVMTSITEGIAARVKMRTN